MVAGIKVVFGLIASNVTISSVPNIRSSSGIKTPIVDFLSVIN